MFGPQMFNFLDALHCPDSGAAYLHEVEGVDDRLLKSLFSSAWKFMRVRPWELADKPQLIAFLADGMSEFGVARLECGCHSAPSVDHEPRIEFFQRFSELQWYLTTNEIEKGPIPLEVLQRTNLSARGTARLVFWSAGVDSSIEDDDEDEEQFDDYLEWLQGRRLLDPEVGYNADGHVECVPKFERIVPGGRHGPVEKEFTLSELECLDVVLKALLGAMDNRWLWSAGCAGKDKLAGSIDVPSIRGDGVQVQLFSPADQLADHLKPSNWLLDGVRYRCCFACGKEIPETLCLACECAAVFYCGEECKKARPDHTNPLLLEGQMASMCSLYKVWRLEALSLSNGFFAFEMRDDVCETHGKEKKGWLQAMRIHNKGVWRRECACFDSVPYGQLWRYNDKGRELHAALQEGPMALDWVLPVNQAPEVMLPIGGIYQESSLELLECKTWREYYSLRELPSTSPAAVLLSYPLTIYHCLWKLVHAGRMALTPGSKVVCHLIGVEKELDFVPLFAEIANLLPAVSLQLHMIGNFIQPEMSHAMLGPNMHVVFWKGMYGPEAKCLLPCPDVVIALNAGMQQVSPFPIEQLQFGGTGQGQNTAIQQAEGCEWHAALTCIQETGVPFFFTDHTRAAMFNSVMTTLRAAGIGDVGVGDVSVNPFRSPLIRTLPMQDLPSIQNGFLCGVNVS